MKKLWLIFLFPVLFAGVDFDGTDDYIDVGTMGNFGQEMDTNISTFSCWVKSSNTDSLMTVLGTFNDGTNTGLQIVLNSNSNDVINAGYIKIFIRDEDNTNLCGAVLSNTGITDGSWHNLVVIIDAANNVIKVYIDNVSKTLNYTFQETPNNMANFAYNLWIGSDNNRGASRNEFDGIINEIAIWNTELTMTEISILANSRIKRMPLQIQPNNLKAYWALDDESDGSSCDGDTFLDYSGNGNNGTGDDGANASGLEAKAEEVLSYPGN